MHTCPWCGTTFPEFAPNCKNCGGPLDSPQKARHYFDEDLPPAEPPPAPRPISDSYARKILLADGTAVASGIFILLGGIFSILGLILTVIVITAFIGLPFFLIGIIFLGIGVPVLMDRYNKARKTVQVLRDGDSTIGEIKSVEVNSNVRVNRQHPWTISYCYQVAGKEYEGQVSSFNAPGPLLTAGRRASILYLLASPEVSSLYPHP